MVCVSCLAIVFYFPSYRDDILCFSVDTYCLDDVIMETMLADHLLRSWTDLNNLIITVMIKLLLCAYYFLFCFPLSIQFYWVVSRNAWLMFAMSILAIYFSSVIFYFFQFSWAAGLTVGLWSDCWGKCAFSFSLETDSFFKLCPLARSVSVCCCSFSYFTSVYPKQSLRGHSVASHRSAKTRGKMNHWNIYIHRRVWRSAPWMIEATFIVLYMYMYSFWCF